MKQMIISATIALAATLSLAAPAGAHINDNVPANEQRDERQDGPPFSGFVGPVEDFIGSDSYVKAHSGMECGALRNPNMTALGPVVNGGIGFDDRFLCPSA